MQVWIWDKKDPASRRQCATVDVKGWAELGYILCAEEYKALPADVQKYLETQVVQGQKEAEGKKSVDK